MDPRTIEINNLRVLNDYLNQTIELLSRSTRNNYPLAGLSHSPFASSVFGASPFSGGIPGVGVGATMDPTLAGLSHTSSVNPFTVGASPLNGQFASVLDPFGVTRGLSHTSNAFNTQFNPVWDMLRQQQVQQAIYAQQLQTIATLRAMGVHV